MELGFRSVRWVAWAAGWSRVWGILWLDGTDTVRPMTNE